MQKPGTKSIIQHGGLLFAMLPITWFYYKLMYMFLPKYTPNHEYSLTRISKSRCGCTLEFLMKTKIVYFKDSILLPLVGKLRHDKNYKSICMNSIFVPIL